MIKLLFLPLSPALSYNSGLQVKQYTFAPRKVLKRQPPGNVHLVDGRLWYSTTTFPWDISESEWLFGSLELFCNWPNWELQINPDNLHYDHKSNTTEAKHFMKTIRKRYGIIWKNTGIRANAKISPQLLNSLNANEWVHQISQNQQPSSYHLKLCIMFVCSCAATEHWQTRLCNMQT